MPGVDWLKLFLQRHNDEIGERMANNVKMARAAVSREVLSKYFDNLKLSLENVPPENIYNYDETNLSDDSGRKKVVAKRGQKYGDRIINHTKSSTSIMFCGSAAGELLPPYVVYKSENLWSTWCDSAGGPRGTRYNRTKHGWFDSVTFNDWFERLLLPKLKK